MHNIVKSYKHLSHLFIKIWAHFVEEEKFFLFDHTSSSYFIGVKRKKIFNHAQLLNEPYVFYPYEFFADDAQNTREKGICFEYFLVVKNNEFVLNTFVQDVLSLVSLKNKILPCENNCLKPVSHADDYANWEMLFNAIQENIEAQNVTKVVASRKVEFRAENNIDTASMLLKLFENNPHTYIFASHLDGKTFLGASPELLVKKNSSEITSFAIAGTISKNENNKEAQGKVLLYDEKNRFEHTIVVQNIQNAMETMLLASSEKSDPRAIMLSKTALMELKNLFHLKTMLTAKDETYSLLDWVRALHPTPAMGGAPKELALAIIKEHEKHDRKFYAAPFGIIEKNGNGLFIVGIRSALIQENVLYAYAGCGIVAQSQCLEEYEEINNKLQTILECFEVVHA